MCVQTYLFITIEISAHSTPVCLPSLAETPAVLFPPSSFLLGLQSSHLIQEALQGVSKLDAAI